MRFLKQQQISFLIKKYIILIIYFFIEGLIFAQSTDTAQSLFDYRHALHYARYLDGQGQYGLAVQEYERAWFLQPGDSVGALLLRASRRGGDYGGGLSRAALLGHPDTYPPAIAGEYLRLLIRNGGYQRAISYLGQGRVSVEDSLALQIPLWLLINRWQTADSLLQKLHDKRLDQLYKPSIIAFQNIHYKSPATAACLSAVVPGAGKIYANQWKDGLFALLLVSVNAYQSYRGFQQQGIGSVRGWVFGGLAAGFYVGNIYGSAQAVKRGNRNQTAKARQLVEQAMDKAF